MKIGDLVDSFAIRMTVLSSEGLSSTTLCALPP